MTGNLPAQNEHNRLLAEAVVRYRTADVRGIKIFYREAGMRDAPALLLLHGFPSASHAQGELPDTGHFALETHSKEIAAIVSEFLQHKLDVTWNDSATKVPTASSNK
jgi:hypothetical protein